MTAHELPAQDAAHAGAAVARLFACTLREALATTALVVLPAALAAVQHRYAWAALFGAIVAPILFASLALQLARAVLGPSLRWPAAWVVLFGALMAGSALGLGWYHRSMEAFGLPGMADPKVLAASAGVAALVLGVPLWHAQGQARARQLAGLRQAALVAEMKALQAQVEPHFLYNTLANTRYLARRDPDKAAQMLEHLIAYLHGALPDMRASASTLGREFELANHYLALMQIRFGERLHYSVDCPSELAEASIPPLMLMTLVENAVKHGLEPQPGAVAISLSALRRDDALEIIVGDDGAGLGSEAPGAGVGLRNLRERLGAMYGAAANFRLLRTEAGRTEARLTLPAKPLLVPA